ncbi:MAG TPA: RHS repeat-associated core domain-containing protein, partial [Ilumatobacteraceae bacterium]|nr:RHS repeat-associated core domain-containing protein [Ilumatobacteraceae bacterium]
VWNANGHAASLSYPDLGAVDYLPNGLGQPTKVGTFASGVTWHPNGAIAGFTYGNGIVHSQSQTTRGLPQVREDTGALQDHYAWDGNGNVAAITDQRIAPPQSRTRSMAYDGRDRLTSTGFPFAGSTFSYSYDPLDNLRTVSATGGRNHRLEYAANGRLTRLYDPASPGMDVIGYAYDARGNTTDRTSATGFVPDQSFVVDEANRVRSTSGRVVQGYAYDGHGRRTRTTTGSNTRVQVYARDGRLLLEDNAARNAKLIKPVSYLYLGNRLLAQQHDDGSRKYVHTDVLGSVVAESTAAPPAITQRPMWEAYGAPWNGSFTHGPGYAGHAMDTATKLVYMQQRYHDPYAGRFLAVDPVAASAGSFNRYWYANNN